MKKFLILMIVAVALCDTTSFAADLPTKAPLYKAAPVSLYNWTGLYAGVNIGAGMSQTTASANVVSGSVDRGDVGFAGGAQAGYNWQFDPSWVAGIEGDIGYLGIKRSLQDFLNNAILGVRTDWYGTIRARLGYTNGPSLFYATGGAAFVNIKNNQDNPFATSIDSSKSHVDAGWTAGGGIETALGSAWSAKAEYLYIDAGSQNVSNRINTIAHFDNRFHVYRYGLNYKFGGPVVSRGVLPAYNWTGLYVGANGGLALAQVAVNAPSPEFVNGHGSSADIVDVGFSGGAQGGYNWQFNPNWVAGIEGDIAFLGIKRSNNLDHPLNGAFGVKADWYSTIRGRLGYSTGPALLYVTGGAAFVNVKNKFDDAGKASFASKSETATGWTVGGGIEAALAQNWTAKTEYLYIDAGSQDVFNPNIVGKPDTAHFDNRFHLFRAGLNYKFGG